MKQFILDHIQIISASLNLLVILMYYLDDKYDITNKQCECGYKKDNVLESESYTTWFKKEQENQFNVELVAQQKMLDNLAQSNLKYNIFEDYPRNSEEYLIAYQIFTFCVTHKRDINQVLNSPRIKYIVNQMLKINELDE